MKVSVPSVRGGGGGGEGGAGSAAVCQLLFAGKRRTDLSAVAAIVPASPVVTEGPKVAQAGEHRLLGAAEMWLSLLAALILWKEETVTSQRCRNQDLLAEHNLQTRDRFCGESPRLLLACVEPEKNWQPPGPAIFPPGCWRHVRPPNSPSPIHCPGLGWHGTGISIQP